MHFPVSAGCFLTFSSKEFLLANRLIEGIKNTAAILFVCKFTYIQSVPWPNEQQMRQVEVACSGSGLECLDRKYIYSPDIKLNGIISRKGK